MSGAILGAGGGLGREGGGGASLGRGGRIRLGLRRAARRGAVLGGFRPASDERNRQSHAMAMGRALTYRDVLEAGRDKTLMALSLDLATAGCLSGSGKPLTPAMVRRPRHRLDEAKQALAAQAMKEALAIWPLMAEIRRHAKQRNPNALRWLLKMATKERGEPFADLVVQVLLATEDAGWIRVALEDP